MLNQLLFMVSMISSPCIQFDYMISSVLNPDMNHQWHDANGLEWSSIDTIKDSGITGPAEMDILYDCRISTV